MDDPSVDSDSRQPATTSINEVNADEFASLRDANQNDVKNGVLQSLAPISSASNNDVERVVKNEPHDTPIINTPQPITARKRVTWADDLNNVLPAKKRRRLSTPSSMGSSDDYESEDESLRSASPISMASTDDYESEVKPLRSATPISMARTDEYESEVKPLRSATPISMASTDDYESEVKPNSISSTDEYQGNDQPSNEESPGLRRSTRRVARTSLIAQPTKNTSRKIKSIGYRLPSDVELQVEGADGSYAFLNSLNYDQLVNFFEPKWANYELPPIAQKLHMARAVHYLRKHCIQAFSENSVLAFTYRISCYLFDFNVLRRAFLRGQRSVFHKNPSTPKNPRKRVLNREAEEAFYFLANYFSTIIMDANDPNKALWLFVVRNGFNLGVDELIKKWLPGKKSKSVALDFLPYIILDHQPIYNLQTAF